MFGVKNLSGSVRDTAVVDEPNLSVNASEVALMMTPNDTKTGSVIFAQGRFPFSAQPSDVAIRPNFGGRTSENEALAVVVNRLTTAIDPQTIWLFGSRARGDARPDSDFDLLIVGKADGDLTSDDYERLDCAINGLGISCDLVPCSAEDFAAGAGLRTSFVARILSEGRRVYEAP